MLRAGKERVAFNPFQQRQGEASRCAPRGSPVSAAEVAARGSARTEMPFSFQKFPRTGELAHLPRREQGEGGREDGVGPAGPQRAAVFLPRPFLRSPCPAHLCFRTARGGSRPQRSCAGQRGCPVPGAALRAPPSCPAPPTARPVFQLPATPRRSRGQRGPTPAALTPGASPGPRRWRSSSA